MYFILEMSLPNLAPLKKFYDVSINEKEVFEQLGEQNYSNSKIFSWKFRNVQRAIRFLAISLVLLLITAVYDGVLRIV